MQVSGTLRKRRKRNLTKVNGLTTVQYDEDLDTFTGQNLFSNEYEEEQQPFTSYMGHGTRLKLSSAGMIEHRREAENNCIRPGTRVTRDPNYHYFENDVINNDSIEEIWENRRESSVVIEQTRELPEHLQGRSHLLDKIAMRRIKQIILLGATSGMLPWTWNEAEHKIDRWSSAMEKLWLIQWTFVSLQMCFLCIFQTYTFYKSVSMHGDSYREVFQASLCLLWYLWALLFNINMCFYNEKMRKYVNTMLAFNKKYVQKYLIHLDGYKMSGRLMINVVSVTNMCQVPVMVCQFLSMPYKPWFLFSYIYPKPWYWLIPGAMQEYVITGQVITYYILLTWIMVAHTNTLQLWLREIHHNNDSDFTTDELRTAKTGIETYKALLVLNQLFNECMSPMAWPILKFHLSAGLVPCGYVVIRSINHFFWDEFPGILFYPVGIWDCATGGFAILNMTSSVFDLGCSFIDSWSQTKHKDFRRILMSCPSIKIWVGRFYFVTISTTLTFFKAVFDVITDLIITFP